MSLRLPAPVLAVLGGLASVLAFAPFGPLPADARLPGPAGLAVARCRAAPRRLARILLGLGRVLRRSRLADRRPAPLRRHAGAARGPVHRAARRLHGAVADSGRLALRAFEIPALALRCGAVCGLLDSGRMAARLGLHRFSVARGRLFADSAQPSGRVRAGPRRLWRRLPRLPARRARGLRLAGARQARRGLGSGAGLRVCARLGELDRSAWFFRSASRWCRPTCPSR